MSVSFGVTLPQFTDDAATFVDGARRVEALGFDSLWLFDHLWPLSGGKQRPVLESWTSLAYLAAATREVGIGTLVTRSSLRRPAVLAKMAATVATIAPGRVTVAIGSGDAASRAENEAFGIPYYGGPERVEQLVSAVEVVQRYLHQGEMSLSDRYESMVGLPTSPRPERVPPVWIGGRSPEVLEIAGRLGNGWNGWGTTPEEFELSAAAVQRAAGDREVEMTWGGLVIIAETDDEANAKVGSRDPRDYLIGGPETVARALTRIVEAGASHLIVTVTDPAAEGIYELLARDVRPRLGGR